MTMDVQGRWMVFEMEKVLQTETFALFPGFVLQGLKRGKKAEK